MEKSSQSYRNRLLELLHPLDLDRLRQHLEPVVLEYRQSLYEANEPITSVYFPIDGVVSLVNTMADGSTSEVGTIGNERVVGLPVILGDRFARISAYVLPGTGLRLPADILTAELERSSRTADRYAALRARFF
jgi:CRP-like cAMP-binding protein